MRRTVLFTTLLLAQRPPGGTEGVGQLKDAAIRQPLFAQHAPPLHPTATTLGALQRTEDIKMIELFKLYGTSNLSQSTCPQGCRSHRGGQSKRLQAWTGLGLGGWQSSSPRITVRLESANGRWVHATVRVIRPTPQVAEQELHSPVFHLWKPNVSLWGSRFAGSISRIKPGLGWFPNVGGETVILFYFVTPGKVFLHCYLLIGKFKNNFWINECHYFIIHKSWIKQKQNCDQ